MTPTNDSNFADLDPRDVLALVRTALNRRKIEVRRSLGAAIGSLIVAAVLLVLGVLCLVNCGTVVVLGLLGLGLLLGALWNLVLGLVGVLDRSPQLTLDADMLIDHRAERRYPWSMIRRATLRRTTRNGVQQSATLILQLNELLAQREARINLADLDHDGSDIFRLVGERAGLE